MTSAVERLTAGFRAAAPGDDAIRFEDTRWDRGRWSAEANAHVARLRAAGVGVGDRVAVLADSSPWLLAAVLGHLRAGICHVPINTRYREAEIEHILADSGASLVLVDEAHAQRIADTPTGARLPRLALAPAGAAGAVPTPAPAIADGATAVLIYTSGTTGKSKGVELSHRALVDGIGALTTLWRWQPADRLVLALPLFHVHGLGIGVYGSLLRGNTITLLPRFSAVGVVDAIADGATIFMGVPTMYSMLLEHLDSNPGDGAVLGRARLFTSGSAALPADDFRRFEAATGHRILERYGMTETLLTLSNPYEGERRPGSVGLPVPGCEARVVDEAGHAVADGETGELWVRWPGLMSGYWGRPEATADALRDGWFRTGDVVVRAPDGYLSIVGRKSVDIIKSGGFKISAREIEEVIARHPLVRECAVIGVPDPRWGQSITVAVVPASPTGAQALLEQLAAHVGAELADYKKPRGLMLVDALPRNALGKLQKHRLLSRAEHGLDARA